MKRISAFERLVMCRDSETSADLCWLWMGARDSKGYGRIKVDGKNRRVHIVAFELATGRRLKPGHTVEHTCKNTSCWRPSHFLELTRAENTARGNRANPRNTERARQVRLALRGMNTNAAQRIIDATNDAAARIVAAGREPLYPQHGGRVGGVQLPVYERCGCTGPVHTCAPRS